MIPNITRGGDLAGVVAYLGGPGNENEHEHPELIAASPGVALETNFRAINLEGRRNQRWLARALDAPRVAWGREIRKRDKSTGEMKAAHVWHCSLTLAPGEQLTEAQWALAGRQFVKAMKFDTCEWALVKHGKTGRDQLDHAHLVINLVQTESGKPANLHNDFHRAQAACAKLSRQLGLTELQGQQRHLPKPERRQLAPRRLRQGVRHEVVGRYERAEAIAAGAGRAMTSEDLEAVGLVQRTARRGSTLALAERRDVAIPLSDINGRIDEDNAALKLERDLELVERGRQANEQLAGENRGRPTPAPYDPSDPRPQWEKDHDAMYDVAPRPRTGRHQSPPGRGGGIGR